MASLAASGAAAVRSAEGERASLVREAVAALAIGFVGEHHKLRGERAEN